VGIVQHQHPFGIEARHLGGDHQPVGLRLRCDLAPGRSLRRDLGTLRDQFHQTLAVHRLHDARIAHAGHFEERREEVFDDHGRIHARVRCDAARPAEHERHADASLVA